ncbi:MAG: hypothetical protein ABSG07_00505 [Terriglobales bacterium]|jgi:hypothetical protein
MAEVNLGQNNLAQNSLAQNSLAQKKINKYLQDLTAALRTLPSEQASDIVEELRSHIVDKVAVSGDMTPAAVDSALAALGRPEDLASLYLTDDLQLRALASRSPLLILRSLFRWASLSFAGFFVLISSLLGYFLSGALIACALLRPIHPLTAGLWLIPNAEDYEISLRLGFGSVPPGGRDLLGWWIVPIGLAVGFGLFFLTARFGLWSIRRLRRARRIGAH